MGETVRIIKFKNNSDAAKVSEKSRKIIKELMETAGISEITITITARDANEQARAMYNNLEAEGAEAQKELYGSAGDKIIDTYSESKKAGKSQIQIILDMKQKIDILGIHKVSKHGADFSKINVIDISPQKLKPKIKLPEFEKAIKESSKIDRYFFPPKDPAIHIEIKQ